MSWGYVFLGFLLLVVLAGIIFVAREVQSKHILIWLGSYVRDRRLRSGSMKKIEGDKPVHILFCMVDHFEPISEGSTREQERERMRDWLERYPALARKHCDSDGRPPQHSWFYPGENYQAEYLDGLARLCQQSLGEIELHLHHGFDTAETLRGKLEKALRDFSKHGALVTQEIPPRQVYGFIHGNMALDNSMNDPALCGVNAEITVLKDTGCYADFSMPTAPCISQPKKINAVYYAIDDRDRPKSHDTGIDAEVGRQAEGDLLIIPGPLAFNWHSRKLGIIPRIENAEIQSSNPPTAARIRNWVKQHVHVKGRPEWVIVKVSCHGAEDRSREALLGDSADQMYSDLEKEYRDRTGYRLHYVTARELYNIVKAAEAGRNGDPDMYRDYVIPQYQTHR
jgi:hypothetical protein